MNSPERERILDLSAGFGPACVLGAAAELDLFTRLRNEPMTAQRAAERLDADLRGITILLDALVALEVLDKQGETYSVPEAIAPYLVDDCPESTLPMIRHRMVILRGWSQLAWTVRAGIPSPRPASIRGPAADRAAFVAAMHAINAPVANQVVATMGPLDFKHALDVGGASGTWTMALLRAAPGAKATIFDLPDAIGQAHERFKGTEFFERVQFAPGDFYVDELPSGADFAWVSAIVHQHSRKHNRELFAKVFRALEPGGRIAIRDIVMEPSRTAPVEGAMFAINMLAGTETGGTFTFQEFAEDLQAAGFVDPRLAVKTSDMNSIVIARKP